ncbi:hypothetical protein [Oceaniglobus roseus]|uniref:hypothetical protein n=1 Tax=Oceaniglobus roseus TaxID=1737570 RepID=UPI000C7ED57B|nr:hypothetical protein [Kandeliimicrobium roseum]
MRVVRLIADFNLIQTRLVFAIRNGSPIGDARALTTHAAGLLEKIERTDASTRIEQEAKIAFYLDRVRRRVAGLHAHRDLATALDLIERLRSGRSLARRVADHSHDMIDRMIERAPSVAAVSRVVNGSGTRCSIYGADHRAVAFSRPNAAFYGSVPERIVGRHIGNLIGSFRYDTRARARMDATLSGTPQTYVYPLVVPALGPRAIQCQMKPLRDETGRPAGIVMMMDDVSETLGL